MGKANEKTAVITLFDVDEAAMKGMMEDQVFKDGRTLFEKHIPFALTQYHRVTLRHFRLTIRNEGSLIWNEKV